MPAPSYLPNTQNQTVQNGSETYRGNPGQGWQLISGGGASGGGSTDPIESAKKILEFQKTANQPVVQSLQGQVDPLKQRYSDLISSIKGQQQTAENRQTVTTNNELGRRGISADSGIAQQEMTNALNPVTAQFSGQIANTGMAQEKDLGELAARIASLQAGNPDSAISGGLQYAGQQQQAQAEAARIAQAQAQADREYELQKAASGANKNQFATLGEGQTLYDLFNNKALYTNPKTYKADGEESNGWGVKK